MQNILLEQLDGPKYDEQTPTKPAPEFKKCVKKYSNTKMTLYDIVKLDKMSYKQKYMV